MNEFLPRKFRQALSCFNHEKIYELRIRLHCPTYINLLGQYKKLLTNGTNGVDIITEKEDLIELLNNVSNYSIYSVSEQIRQGFVTLENGIRIGIAGKGVTDNETILSIQEISSLCIRFPHRVIGCTKLLQQYCFRPNIESVLISSPPGLGKTTFLRDIAETTFDSYYNFLIVDERGELSPYLKSTTSDIIKCMNKKQGILYGIRVLRPDVIITDELTSSEFEVIHYAIQCGIKVVCSTHQLERFDGLPFAYRVFLGRQIGKITKIIDLTGRTIYEAV